MDEPQSEEVFDDAYELYQEIRDSRGLHLRDGDGRDDVLYRELQDLIGCHNENIADFLREENKSADWLLRQFLQLAAPFARMFSEIWDFLSSEKAPRATENLRVRFGFNEDDVTEVDLEQFREWAETARKISVGVHVAYWSDDAVNELFELQKCINIENQHGSEYRRGEPYKLPTIETYRGDDFKDYIWRVRDLFQQIIDEQTSKDGSYNSAFGVEDSEMPLVNLTDLLPAWEPIFKNYQIVSEEDRRQSEKYFREHIEPELEMQSIVAPLNYHSPLDILRLPFWEKRWHTYEIWMTVQTLKALNNYDPQVRINDGRIPIDGGDEAVVADLERIRKCNACVVSELRTPYKPEEREAIRPDLSLCRTQEPEKDGQPVSIEQLDKETRAVIIEYKQRETLRSSHAEKTAELYLNGSPEAVGLVMVNYDEPADVDYPDKAKLIGNVRPSSPKVREYRQTVQEFVKEIELFEKIPKWTVLIDVSGSMGDVYLQSNIKESLLKMDGSRIEMYMFNSGLIENPQVLRSDIKSGLQTKNGTDIENAIKELFGGNNKPENLLVVTDRNYSAAGSIQEDLKNLKVCKPQDLLSLDDLGNEFSSAI